MAALHPDVNYIGMEVQEGVIYYAAQKTAEKDCTEWCQEHGKTITELQHAGVRVGVIWQDGRPFHSPCGIRMNLALPFSLVEEAMERLTKYVFI